MARSKYDVILVSLIKHEKDLWDNGIRDQIAKHLETWFKDVLSHSSVYSNSTVRCWWRYNAALVEDDELVVYFYPVASYGDIPPGKCAHAGGCTFQHTKGMLSEIYVRPVADAPNRAQLLAVLAFHEIMHNKLDAERNSVIPDLHNHFHGNDQKASKPKVGFNDTPSGEEKKLLGQHLDRPVKQFLSALMKKRKPLF
ncbi:MAG: hypothetical protein H6970_00515 [Gammaproteobacteria bacterium]|nr:hypothetical protein [Gammaproteobacteria bacterium]MCP5423542.1 hypothetical protein [Gammaproteobacteria bacterium]